MIDYLKSQLFERMHPKSDSIVIKISLYDKKRQIQFPSKLLIHLQCYSILKHFFFQLVFSKKIKKKIYD